MRWGNAENDKRFEPCPGCRAVLPARTGPTHPYMLSSAACWANSRSILASSYEHPERRPVHQLVVDAFAVQHPGAPGRREAQSVGLHLMTLCMMLEEGADPKQGPALHKRMIERPVFRWLEPPVDRGSVTATDVAGATDAAGHVDAVRRWAQSAWEAWEPHHATVRDWIARGRSG